MNLVTPEAEAKHTLLFDNSLWNGFVEHLSRTLVRQQSVTKFIEINAISMVTPEAAAKHELLLDNSLRDGFVEHLSMTQVGKQSVTEFESSIS